MYILTISQRVRQLRASQNQVSVVKFCRSSNCNSILPRTNFPLKISKETLPSHKHKGHHFYRYDSISPRIGDLL